MRAAGNVVNDVPTQFDAASRHSIVIPNRLEVSMHLYGVISHLNTRKPTGDELERYQAGFLQTIEHTADVPWEPYSPKFTETELVAQTHNSVAVYDTCI